MTLVNFLVAIGLAYWGLWQYRKLLKWKRDLLSWKAELQAWQTRRDEVANGVLERMDHITAWERDLEHREQVWKDFKQKVEKDLKWNWKI